MRLIKLRLKHFRRFAAEQSLDLNEDLIALVGSNEAGKSSVLTAIDLLGRGEHPERADVTRGQDGPASISGLFVFTMRTGTETVLRLDPAVSDGLRA